MEKILEQDLVFAHLKRTKRRIIDHIFKCNLTETLRIAKELKIPYSNLLKIQERRGLHE